MKDWKETLVSPETPLIEALEKLDRAAFQIVLVVDEAQTLLGTITDGDVRRALLKSTPLTDPVREVMKTHPITASADETRDSLLAAMTATSLKQLPIVDDDGRVTGLETLEELVRTQEARENWVVILAGGLGTRLRPLTNTIPKPMLKVGNKPILETIIDSFVKQGFHRFYISVNYRSDVLKDYFGDGSQWHAEIRYLEEGEALGTAGPLSLIEDAPDAPLVVINGDILTKVNFESLLDYHLEHDADLTVAVREYDIQIPFGVIQIDSNWIKGIDEKPLQKFLVNAGIYVLNPELLDTLPRAEYFDMPDFMEALLAKEGKLCAFPIREFWLDVGRMDDLERANTEFTKIF